MAATIPPDKTRSASRESEPLVRPDFLKIRSASGYFEPPFVSAQAGSGNHPPLPPPPVDGVVKEEHPKRRKNLEANSVESTYSTCRYLGLLYALVVIVLGTAFPLAEIISIDIQPFFYQSFYLYLYGTSLLFLAFAYGFLFNTGRRQKNRLVSWLRGSVRSVHRSAESISDSRKDDTRAGNASSTSPPRVGSFYLRVGALLFGVGAMLYSILEFGQYYEASSGSSCDNILVAVTPAARFVFSFAQLYVVFLNSKIRTDRFMTVANFGLMHMIATNVCVWLSVLIEETKHQMEMSIFQPEAIRPSGFPPSHDNDPALIKRFPILSSNYSAVNETALQEEKGQKLQQRLQVYFSGVIQSIVNESKEHEASCRSLTTVGSVLQQASPFLYPCIVENSLICAALLYMMWSELESPLTNPGNSMVKIKKQQFSVDCHGATRGLFLGLIMVVITIMSMVLFFVWIWMPGYYALSIFQAYITEIVLFSTTLLAVCVAFYQLRKLQYDPQEGSRLDDTLLIISQMGVYVFPVFILIAGHHNVVKSATTRREDICALVCAGLEILQSTLQTLFLLDAGRRRPSKTWHVRKKPGREMVTFLLVCNFNFWAIDSLEAWRQQLYPMQIDFYGSWAWTVITHVSMPLLIYYRFHSSVCLSEVWKCAYKMKAPQVADTGS